MFTSAIVGAKLLKLLVLGVLAFIGGLFGLLDEKPGKDRDE